MRTYKETNFKDSEIGKIPHDWEVKELGEIFDIKAGGDAQKLNISKNEEGKFIFPIYSNSLLDNGLYGYSDIFQFTENTITITARGEVGKAVYRNHKYCAIVRLLVLIPRDRIDCFYVTNFINSRLNFELVGAAQNQLTSPMISKKKVALPPTIQEQESIAKILSDLDSKIEMNKKINETLEEMGKTLFKRWFVDFEFPNQEGLEYKSNGGEMVFNEELGKEIPKGWKVGRLGDLVEVTTGKGRKRNEFVENGQFPIVGANGHIGRCNEYLYDKKLVLTGRVGTLGEVYFYDEKIWISDNVLISIPKKEKNIFYVYYFLKNSNLLNLNSGSTQPLITQTSLKNITLIIPNEESLNNFQAQIEPIFKKIKENELEIENLQSTRDYLLPKLMRGEIRVEK